MAYELVHYDAFGQKDVQTFADLWDVQWEINRLEQCLEDRDSWRIRDTIAQLQEIIAENSPEEDQ
jgi:uncharacterized protein YjaG (DUF416 family)